MVNLKFKGVPLLSELDFRKRDPFSVQLMKDMTIGHKEIGSESKSRSRIITRRPRIATHPPYGKMSIFQAHIIVPARRLQGGVKPQGKEQKKRQGNQGPS